MFVGSQYEFCLMSHSMRQDLYNVKCHIKILYGTKCEIAPVSSADHMLIDLASTTISAGSDVVTTDCVRYWARFSSKQFVKGAHRSTIDLCIVFIYCFE